MPGGKWETQNKVRPGAYINFKSVPRPMQQVGNRGISTIILDLDWGDNTKLIDVYSDELLDGKSLSKVGFTAFDEESKILNIMLQYCYLVKVFRGNVDGVKATGTIGNLEINAKYFGTFGNKITITVVDNTEKDENFEVQTFVDSILRDKQSNVVNVEDLESNDYVDFEGTGLITANAGVLLTGGTNGTFEEETAYPDYLDLLKTASWQTLACTSDATGIKTSVTTYIKNLRDDNGKYVQAVVNDYSADHEGIINNINGIVISEVLYTPQETCAIICAMTSGAKITESNTAKVIQNATEIIGQLDNAEIIEALQKGKLVLSENQNGEIKVEQDINSFTSFTALKNNSFRKNRVIRTLDEIGTSTKLTWETVYMGKVDNNESGRDIYKTDIDAYLKELNRMNAIQNHDITDISISQGNEIDTVITILYVQPVDSMEKLYMEVNVIA